MARASQNNDNAELDLEVHSPLSELACDSAKNSIEATMISKQKNFLTLKISNATMYTKIKIRTRNGIITHFRRQQCPLGCVSCLQLSKQVEIPSTLDYAGKTCIPRATSHFP